MKYYEIREIEKRDNQQIREVILSVSQEYGTYNPSEGASAGAGAGAGDVQLNDLFSTYLGQGKKYFIAVNNNSQNIVGGGGYMRLEGSIDNKLCEMQKLFLLPEARGQGLGKAIAELIISEAIKDGYFKMYLESAESMKEAKSLYAMLGFKHLDKPLGKTGHFQCQIFMLKELQ